MLTLIDEMYPLKKCRQQEFRPGVRPCLNYFIGKCPGICIGEADRDQYQTMIDEIIDVLNGHDTKLISSLEQKMNDAAERLEYEDAAKYRDYIISISVCFFCFRVPISHDLLVQSWFAHPRQKGKSGLPDLSTSLNGMVNNCLS